MCFSTDNIHKIMLTSDLYVILTVSHMWKNLIQHNSDLQVFRSEKIN